MHFRKVLNDILYLKKIDLNLLRNTMAEIIKRHSESKIIKNKRQNAMYKENPLIGLSLLNKKYGILHCFLIIR